MCNLLKLQAFLLLFLISNIWGQEYFEGEIHYTITYETLNKNVPISYLETEMGRTFSAYIQENRYIMVFDTEGQNGWTKIMVALEEGYTYTEFQNSDTIAKTKFGLEKNHLINFQRNKDLKKQVLNEICESITISYQPSDPNSFYTTFNGTYYFNPKYKLNTKSYEHYTDGFWNLFVNEAQSISIRNETEFYPLFKSVQEATSIEPKEISDEMFELNPSKVVIEKNTPK